MSQSENQNAAVRKLISRFIKLSFEIVETVPRDFNRAVSMTNVFIRMSQYLRKYARKNPTFRY